MIEKILCIQLKQIGDVLMTTPAIRALARAKPRAEIHFLTQKPSDQIYQYHPSVAKVITIPSKPSLSQAIKIVRKLRKERYSIVIDFLGLPKSAFISRLTGSRIRIGYKKRGRALFYTHPVDTQSDHAYSAMNKLSLVKGLNTKPTNSKLDFYISEKERQKGKEIIKALGATDNHPLVSLSPVSRREYKIWPPDKFADICDYLVEQYHAQILFLWGPGEYHFVKKVKDRMKTSSLPKYAIPTISETMGMLEHVDLHVGNDNGPMHFAIAAGVPSIGIFGRPLLRNWIPPDSERHLGVEFDPGCKNACFYPKCKLECLHGVKIGEVKDRIDFLMNAVVSSQPH